MPFSRDSALYSACLHQASNMAGTSKGLKMNNLFFIGPSDADRENQSHLGVARQTQLP
jgi:hypothetical protein